MKIDEKIKHIQTDVLKLYLPRTIESVKNGYFDENQAMIIVDHIMRCRILKEIMEKENENST